MSQDTNGIMRDARYLNPYWNMNQSDAEKAQKKVQAVCCINIDFIIH